MSANKYNQEKINCVFLHGWSLNSVVWEECINELPGWVNAIAPDLPGHGQSQIELCRTLDDYVEAVAKLINQPAIWVGWSMGGLIAMKLASKYPEKVTGLYCVATSPVFVQKDSWQCAMSDEVFTGFEKLYTVDSEKTVTRFLSLQVKGSISMKNDYRFLQAALVKSGHPAKETGAYGLDILRQSDLRTELNELKMPVSWLLGEKDEIVPAGIDSELIKFKSTRDVKVIENASHVPFVSHMEIFNTELEKFIRSTV